MTCLVDRVLSEAGMKLHSSTLGASFVYTLALIMTIFNKKSLQGFLEKSSKHFIVHSKVTTMKNLDIFSRNLREDFFLKIGILSPKVYTKNFPNLEACNFIPVPLRPMGIKQVIEVLY